MKNVVLRTNIFLLNILVLSHTYAAEGRAEGVAAPVRVLAVHPLESMPSVRQSARRANPKIEVGSVPVVSTARPAESPAPVVSRVAASPAPVSVPNPQMRTEVPAPQVIIYNDCCCSCMPQKCRAVRPCNCPVVTPKKTKKKIKRARKQPVLRKRPSVKKIITTPPVLKCENPPAVRAETKSTCPIAGDFKQPYLEVGVGGAEYRYSHQQNYQMFSSYDLFLPWFVKDGVFFADARVFDPSGAAFAGSLQFGYRHLIPESNGVNQMIGLYGSFDRMRSSERNDFNQLVLGAEYWLNDFFLGGNFYLPVGTKEKTTVESLTTRKEIVLQGGDAQVGYRLFPGLTGYLGGFYFQGSGAKLTKGVNAKLEYLFYQDAQRRLLGMLDSAKLAIGVEKIASRGLMGWLELKLGIGLGACPRGDLNSFQAHLVEPVRRRSSVVTDLIQSKAVIDGAQATGEVKRTISQEFQCPAQPEFKCPEFKCPECKCPECKATVLASHCTRQP